MSAALPQQWNYIVDVVVNASDAETFRLFQNSLDAIGFPLQLNNNTHITDVSITTGTECISQQRHVLTLVLEGISNVLLFCKSVPLPVAVLVVDVWTSWLGPTISVLHTGPVAA